METNVRIEDSWKNLLNDEFKKDYFSSLRKFVKEEYNHKTVYPPASLIFSAFDHCPVDQVKVIILGQDPYHGVGQANGLSFSVAEGQAIPPSLRNIFKELESDLGIPVSKNGDLSKWASQGVLLLNTTLTVRDAEPGSHQQKGWERFTDEVIKLLAEKRKGLVFMLWGSFAQGKAEFIPPDKHLVLKAAHPSPLSAYRGFWGSKHFSKANEYLLKQGRTPINWSLT